MAEKKSRFRFSCPCSEQGAALIEVLVALLILGLDSLFPGAGLLSNLEFLPRQGIISGVIGGAAGFLFFFIVVLITPKGMGMGDVKLATFIGLVTGFPYVVVALLIGIITGGIVAVALLALRIKGRKDAIPYGTFLAIGPIITLLWGQPIFDWYLNLL